MTKKSMIHFSVAFFCAFSVSLSVFMTGCTKKTETPVIRINDFTMPAAEFEELFQQNRIGEDTPENRTDFLNNLITRKVLLQEAQRLGLDTRKEFLRSIENFWEQSLLKSLIDEETQSLAASTAVTDEEIKNYYEKWTPADPSEKKPLNEIKDLIAWRVRATKNTQALDDWTDRLIGKAKIEINKKALGIDQ